MTKFLLTASALAFGLALYGVASADTGGNKSEANGGGGTAVTANLTGLDHSLDGNLNNNSNQDNNSSTNNNSNQNNDNSTHADSHNVTTTTSVSVALTNSPVSSQILTAEVSKLDAGGDGDHNTGDATLTGAGDTNAQFAGIQTVSQNTGQQSASNAATSVAATANITFGSTGGAGTNNH
jgi:hypothetical protein